MAFLEALHPSNLYILALAGVIGAVIIWLCYLLGLSPDLREPPYVPQKLPYVGHLLGVLRHGTKYYDRIRSVCIITDDNSDVTDMVAL